MKSLDKMEDYDRLARLCEAKDAEITRITHDRDAKSKRMWELVHECDSLDTQLSEAQSQIAMMAEALNAVKAHDDYAGQYSHLHEARQTIADSYADALELVYKAISATSETVAAWRAKETEPLRKEVAMMRDGYEDTFKDLEALNSSPVIGPSKAIGMMLRRMVKILDDTQATALAYEREVENRGAVKALENAYGKSAADISQMIAELRASKGE